MLEILNEVVQERVSETLFPSPVGVIKRVAEIMNDRQTPILFYDLSDYPLPRVCYCTEIVSDQKNIDIMVELELKEEEVEILVFDPTLLPGEPKDHSFCYRLNIFSGESAEKIRGSTGYFVEVIGRNQNLDDGARVVTDNWAETNLSPAEVLEMLGSATLIRLPEYDQEAMTETGTPRYRPLKTTGEVN